MSTVEKVSALAFFLSTMILIIFPKNDLPLYWFIFATIAFIMYLIVLETRYTWKKIDGKIIQGLCLAALILSLWVFAVEPTLLLVVLGITLVISLGIEQAKIWVRMIFLGEEP